MIYSAYKIVFNCEGTLTGIYDRLTNEDLQWTKVRVQYLDYFVHTVLTLL